MLPARHHWKRRVQGGQAGSGVLQLVPAGALCMRVVRQACTAGGVRVLHLWVANFPEGTLRFVLYMAGMVGVSVGRIAQQPCCIMALG